MANENNTQPTPPAPAQVPVVPDFQFPAPLDLRVCIEQTPPVLDFVLPGFLAGTVGGLVSPGGIGKSWLALELAATVAACSGFDMLGLNIEHRGRVAVFAGEDPPPALHHRLHAIGAYMTEAVREAVYEKLTIIPAIGSDVSLDNPGWQNALEAALEGHRLAFIDTLTRFHSLDENKAEDAKRIMSALEAIANKTGCAVCFLHHVSKASALAGLTELQQAARGSSVFVDNARWLSFVAGMSAEEAKAYGIIEDARKNYIRWNISKQNYGAPRPDVWFIRGQHGVLNPVKLELKPKEKKGSKSGGDCHE